MEKVKQENHSTILIFTFGAKSNKPNDLKEKNKNISTQNVLLKLNSVKQVHFHLYVEVIEYFPIGNLKMVSRTGGTFTTER